MIKKCTVYLQDVGDHGSSEHPFVVLRKFFFSYPSQFLIFTQKKKEKNIRNKGTVT